MPEMKSATSMTTRGANPLHVALLYLFGQTVVLNLRQYGDHPLGYTVASPSMIIAVYLDSKSAEALVFQNYVGSRRIFFDDIAVSGGPIKAEMNQFLGQWLANLLAEGGHFIADNICHQDRAA
jgi:uncharacterized protein YqiB (DUF1249 family)